ncbi:MAG: DUF4194 domain-containing protein [Erysipelotrichaceae bacterium]|nr:DUF4194 domain-containing protein [Erysipelotrichaceae bacterium]
MAVSTNEISWSSLNDRDQELFARVCNELTDHTFICQLKYDTRKGRTIKNDDYYYAKKFLPILKEQYARMGWEIKHDEFYRAVMLRRPNHLNSRLSSYTTLFVFGCRLVFDDAVRETGNSEAVDCTESKVIEKLTTLGALATAKTTAADRREALRYLEQHHLIQRKKAGAWSSKESNEFVILPAIAMLLDSLTIQDTLNQILQIAGKKGENDDEFEQSDEE